MSSTNIPMIKKHSHKNLSVITLFMAIALTISGGCGRHRCPINLVGAKKRVEKYYESGQYEKDLDKIVNKTIKHFKKKSSHNNATIIFDVDETVISDYEYAKSISFGYIPKLSHDWVLRADAPAIPHMKRLYDYLISRGFIIIFLTGRKHNEYSATIQNLKAQGFTKFEKLIVRQKKEETLNAQTYKTSHRKKLSKKGYNIVGTIGDQWSDLNGGYSGYKVKLPNVRYFIP